MQEIQNYTRKKDDVKRKVFYLGNQLNLGKIKEKEDNFENVNHKDF